MVTTLIDRRSQYHQSVLVSPTTPTGQNVQNLVDEANQLFIHSGMSLPDAQHRAYATIYQAVQAQAATLGYIDTFWVLSTISAIMFVKSFLLKKNDPGVAAKWRLVNANFSFGGELPKRAGSPNDSMRASEQSNSITVRGTP